MVKCTRVAQRLIKLNRVFSWILFALTIAMIISGYSMTILGLEHPSFRKIHFWFEVFFITLFSIHVFTSVALLRFEWKKTLNFVINRKAGSLTRLRLLQRVSGWSILILTLMVILSGLNWFKLIFSPLLPFPLHLRFDLYLIGAIIVHIAVGVKFALIRRRVRRALEPSKEILLSRRETLKILAGSLLAFLSAIYLDFAPRIIDRVISIAERLPPGQREVERLQILHVGEIPGFNKETWALEIYGRVKNPFTLTYEQLRRLPRAVSVSDFHCVTGWSKFDNKWEGVQFTKIMELAEPLDNANFATIESEGGYTTSLPLADLSKNDVILAYLLDNRDLPPQHGGPLRIVVPHKYAYKSSKWVRKIKFTSEQEIGYWESRGYSNSADPFSNDRYS